MNFASTTTTTLTTTKSSSSPNSILLPPNHTYDQINHRIISFSCARDSDASTGDPSSEAEEDDEEAVDDERLASLEALRYALHHAPFCQSGHTLMSIPDECSLLMQGIPTKCAIRIQNLTYRNVLESVNMEVPKGKIYALLGSSNSGKSTLLKVILGRLRPTSGTVTTFGTCPNKRPLSAICVGYMPQKVTLHEELTVGETLTHYGRLYQLPAYLIRERVQALSTMLHLPSETLPISSLNPGQKWRISLAVSLIHSPPLLLLDEPTVMVDPLIRWSIWNRLERLCDEEGLTVLITTKYPEEIAFAYRVGLIRDGTVLGEDRPEELKRKYACTTYDELYQKFCELNVPRNGRPSILGPFFRPEGSPKVPPNSQKRSQAKTISGGSTSSIPRRIFPIQEDQFEEAEADLEAAQTEATNTRQYLSLTNAGFPNTQNANNYHQTNTMYPILDCLKSSDSGDTGSGTSSSSHRAASTWSLPMAEWPICERRRTAYLSHFINLDLKRLFALVLKNLAIFRGNILSIVIFYFLFPALQILLMCAIFGRTVRHIPVSVPADLALKHHFGPTFVHGFLDETAFEPSYTSTFGAALEQVKKGKSWAAIVPWTSSPKQQEQQQQTVPSSQNASVSSQFCESLRGPNGQIPFGVKLFLDQSNYIIAQSMFYSFISSMRRFLKSETSTLILENIRKHNCPSSPPAEMLNPWWNHSAIEIEEVIYGSTRFRFLEFLLPGFLCAIVFAYSLVLSAYFFIKEQMAGLQERCLTTGTSGIEVLAAHVLSQAALYLLQQTMILLIVFRLYGLPSRGPFYSLWLLIFLQGLVGIFFGLFIAVICPKPLSAALISSALFMPAFFMSGIIWPIEAMHRLVQHLSHAFPLTLPINALRYIISRGPDMRYSQILLGFSISTGYIAVLLLLTVAIFKCKTSS